MTKQFSFPINTKFRVIANHISFYTTKKQILYGVGDLTEFNDALQVVLCAFEGSKTTETKMVGYGGSCRGFQIQLNVADSKK